MRIRWQVTEPVYPTAGEVNALREETGMGVIYCKNELMKKGCKVLQYSLDGVEWQDVPEEIVER